MMHDHDQELANLKVLSRLMDNAFTLPGTNIRFGLDSIIGLLPGIGDTIGLAVSGYIVSVAHKAGVPWHMKIRMAWNIFIDWLIGIIPFLGDIFDIGFKANTRNVALLEKYLGKDILEGDYTRLS